MKNDSLLLVVLTTVLFNAAVSIAAPVMTLADIDFWVGTGANRAALVIDFDDTDATTPALAWGYRFDGTPTAEMMFRDITAADSRLFAKINVFSFGNLVNGIGYDADNNGTFALNDGTVFDVDGIAETGSSDGAMSVDPDDLYREGFLTNGFFNTGIASSSPYDGGTWMSAMVGFSDQIVSDEMFIGFTFDNDFSSFSGPGDFPTNPQAAPAPGSVAAAPEPTSLLGMLICAFAALFGYRLTRRRAV